MMEAGKRSELRAPPVETRRTTRIRLARANIAMRMKAARGVADGPRAFEPTGAVWVAEDSRRKLRRPAKISAARTIGIGRRGPRSPSARLVMKIRARETT